MTRGRGVPGTNKSVEQFIQCPYSAARVAREMEMR